MRCLTLDASVICKWFLRDADDEPGLDLAVTLLDDFGRGRFTLIQPPHWMVEVLSVMARRRPRFADAVLQQLAGYGVATVDDPRIYRRALKISIETGTHLFDALYHAVALDEPDGCLVTADARYHEAAARFGRIIHLEDYEPGVGEPGLDYRGITRRALEAQAHQLR